MWETLYAKLQTNNIPNALEYIDEISTKCNVIRKNIIKDFIDYIIRTYMVSADFLSFVECIMHFTECNEAYYLNYSLLRLASFIVKLCDNKRVFKLEINILGGEELNGSNI